ncbi:dephospho-CoA kinase [bacterium]|nr:dephospho-CoA kinase [bacterium]MBU1072619.1 dephospho-CoA kinase [bacterium]MBU1674508.1 dephospho-CoA kinase [bacterium]
MGDGARRLRRWVVTGPVGAGKSLVTSTLAGLGAHIVDADAEGHGVLHDPAVVAEIAAAFGASCVAAGAVRRDALAGIVFADGRELSRLNRITHGRLSARLAARLDELEREAGQPGLAVVEAAVYFLLPSFGPVDLVIAVTAPEALRADRLVRCGRLDGAEALARIAAQRSMTADFTRADVVLDNSGSAEELRRAVAAIHETYMRGNIPGG